MAVYKGGSITFGSVTKSQGRVPGTTLPSYPTKVAYTLPSHGRARPRAVIKLKVSKLHRHRNRISKEYAKVKVQTFQLFKCILFFNSEKFATDYVIT